jgi:hypothetical protein
VNEHEFVAQIGDVLQGAFGVTFIEEIRDYNDKAALLVGARELARDGEEIARSLYFEGVKEVHGRQEAVPSPAAIARTLQGGRKRLQTHCIEPHQPDIRQRRSELSRIVKLRRGPVPIDALVSRRIRTGMRGSTWNSFNSSFSNRKKARQLTAR